MAAFTPNTGTVVNYDTFSGGSTNATLDTWTISNGTTVKVNTDTYCCANHLASSGSIDTVSFTGQGGKILIDGRDVRVIAYTGGSGNVPAIGTTISQGGVSGYFLGVWASWTVENTVSGSAMPATGFIKIRDKTGGSFAAGALTGITATASGADVVGWIEVRAPETALWTIPRIGAFEVQGDWFELGTTNGTRGQIIAFPTCATSAGTAPGVWIETSAGSGVYEQYAGVGSTVALATWRTTTDMKFVWHTATGWRIGNDGTNGVGYLPPTGCKVRMPNVFLHNCIRTAGSGSGPRVVPNAANTPSPTTPGSTRAEMGTQGAGDIKINFANYYWSACWSQAFRCDLTNSGFNEYIYLNEIASPLNIDNVIVSPNTTAIVSASTTLTSCFAGGTVNKLTSASFSLAASGRYNAIINYVTGVTFNDCKFANLLLRGNATTGLITSTQAVNCTFNNTVMSGGRGLFVGAQNCSFNNTTYYDHQITTTTASTNPMSIWEFTTGCNNITVKGVLLPVSAVGPYTALVTINACYNVLIKEIGTDTVTPLAMNSAVTGLGVNSVGNSDTVTIKRMFLSGTRTGPYLFVNSDTQVLIENVMGDYADTTVQPALNSLQKNIGITSATTGQQSVYGTHWITRFISTTAGFAEILCNEPTSLTASQCSVTGGSPQFNSSGSLLLTKAGDQVTWEMPFFAIGYTAFTNSAPTVTGTNVTFTSGSTWGNHTIEYQIDTGSGWNGTWLGFNNTNLITHTISATTGFKLKVRATTLTANVGNLLTNLRVAMTTTSAAQQTNLYPLSLVNTTLSANTSLVGAEIRIYDLDNAPAGSLGTEISGTESGLTSTYTFQTTGSNTVWIQIMQTGYNEFGMSYTTGSTDTTLPITLVADTNT